MPKPKETAGKPKVHLVPSSLVRAVARAREYGIKKYGDEHGWKMSSALDYMDAAYRHMLDIMDAIDKQDPELLIDKESGVPHLSMLACDVAFVISKLEDGESLIEEKIC